MGAVLQIEGITVKTPQEFSVDISTIDADSSGRNANGEMVRDVIAQKTKLVIKWGPLSDSEVSDILQRINKPFFNVIYPDPQLGRQRTKTFYAGDSTTPSYSWNDKFKAMKWENLSVNFIEK
ncbi:DUF6711 family protein [Lactococcus formosensis]|uniref:DUF6711 family protein n=1 Tax=Lactococcus formosensis TaxID=1281486 RepID=UPI0022E5F423|nr:DUF6711 family protein [Lactococcus formosensis]